MAANEEEVVGESRKLFVGGIPASAHEAELRGHFARFGVVRSIVVMRDRETGRGRGFGFVEFEEEDAAARALGGAAPIHLICGRVVDVKRAMARPPQPLQQEGLKVFVGGLRDSVTEEELRAYFQEFGTVTDVVVIYDSLTSRSRGFGFVTFNSEEAVGKVMHNTNHDLNGVKVETKIAIPRYTQCYRNVQGRGSRPSGGRCPGPYNGTSYLLYNDQHGLYNGYMPQCLPALPYNQGVFYTIGGYTYANVYPNQEVMANVSNMVARCPPDSPYTPMYPGYGGLSYSAGYPGAATCVQSDQASIDVQEIESTAARFEHMKLGSH